MPASSVVDFLWQNAGGPYSGYVPCERCGTSGTLPHAWCWKCGVAHRSTTGVVAHALATYVAGFARVPYPQCPSCWQQPFWHHAHWCPLRDDERTTPLAFMALLLSTMVVALVVTVDHVAPMLRDRSSPALLTLRPIPEPV